LIPIVALLAVVAVATLRVDPLRTACAVAVAVLVLGAQPLDKTSVVIACAGWSGMLVIVRARGTLVWGLVVGGVAGASVGLVTMFAQLPGMEQIWAIGAGALAGLAAPADNYPEKLLAGAIGASLLLDSGAAAMVAAGGLTALMVYRRRMNGATT